MIDKEIEPIILGAGNHTRAVIELTIGLLRVIGLGGRHCSNVMPPAYARSWPPLAFRSGVGFQQCRETGFRLTISPGPPAPGPPRTGPRSRIAVSACAIARDAAKAPCTRNLGCRRVDGSRKRAEPRPLFWPAVVTWDFTRAGIGSAVNESLTADNLPTTADATVVGDVAKATARSSGEAASVSCA